MSPIKPFNRPGFCQFSGDSVPPANYMECAGRAVAATALFGRGSVTRLFDHRPRMAESPLRSATALQVGVRTIN